MQDRREILKKNCTFNNLNEPNGKPNKSLLKTNPAEPIIVSLPVYLHVCLGNDDQIA